MVPLLGAGQGAREKAYLAVMKADLRNLATDQARYAIDNYRYSTTITDLPFTLSEGVTMELLGETLGFSARTTHLALVGTRCAVFMGTVSSIYAPATVAGAMSCDGAGAVEWAVVVEWARHGWWNGHGRPVAPLGASPWGLPAAEAILDSQAEVVLRAGFQSSLMLYPAVRSSINRSSPIYVPWVLMFVRSAGEKFANSPAWTSSFLKSATFDARQKKS